MTEHITNIQDELSQKIYPPELSREKLADDIVCFIFSFLYSDPLSSNKYMIQWKKLLQTQKDF